MLRMMPSEDNLFDSWIGQAKEFCNQGALAGSQNNLECAVAGCAAGVAICAAASTGFFCFLWNELIRTEHQWCKEGWILDEKI